LKVLLQRIEAKNLEHIDIATNVQQLEAISSGQVPVASTPPPVPHVLTDEPSSSVPEVSKPSPALTQESPVEPHKNADAEVAKSAEKDASITAATARSTATEATIRVDVGRLDSLMNLVGELVLGRNRLSQIAARVAEQHENLPIARELMDTGSQIDLITTELQMAVMKTRMVPIGKVFNKLPRLMRELTKEMGKEIELHMSGEETELDKSIIEELNDPLVHILRNAADHGIETPEERQRAGKEPKGSVRVAAQHEGNHIVLSIRDDGRGMDPEKLKQKAIEKGLITEAQASEMSRREVFDLIFAPGFSTAQKVTNVSGRGVGMDVVRTNITRLKGIIEIDSELGKGSTFILKLPLTLAIIQGLLGEVGKEVYCIPLGSVIEVVRVKPGDIKTINGKEVIRLRDVVLPLARLRDLFNISANGHNHDSMYIVVVGLAEQRVGIIVDALLGQREVVIKSLGEYLGSVPGVAGSTILGDGRVIMILDVAQFISLWRSNASIQA
jgi:two-component system chemotaxis sensor kinase CheA